MSDSGWLIENEKMRENEFAKKMSGGLKLSEGDSFVNICEINALYMCPSKRNIGGYSYPTYL